MDDKEDWCVENAPPGWRGYTPQQLCRFLSNSYDTYLMDNKDVITVNVGLMQTTVITYNIVITFCSYFGRSTYSIDIESTLGIIKDLLLTNKLIFGISYKIDEYGAEVSIRTCTREIVEIYIARNLQGAFYILKVEVNDRTFNVAPMIGELLSNTIILSGIPLMLNMLFIYNVMENLSFEPYKVFESLPVRLKERNFACILYPSEELLLQRYRDYSSLAVPIEKHSFIKICNRYNELLANCIVLKEHIRWDSSLLTFHSGLVNQIIVSRKPESFDIDTESLSSIVSEKIVMNYTEYTAVEIPVVLLTSHKVLDGIKTQFVQWLYSPYAACTDYTVTRKNSFFTPIRERLMLELALLGREVPNLSYRKDLILEVGKLLHLPTQLIEGCCAW